MKDHVKIILIGDEGVGKSSLISSYLSRHFPQEVPPVMANAIIPPETTANDVCITIMDSSAKPNDRAELERKIIEADSIIAVYDVSRPQTFESLASFWLPLIKSLGLDNDPNKPVTLVGSKTDLILEEQGVEQLNTLLATYPFVLNCLKCSAINLQDVDEVFFFGELSVNYPLSPIIDLASNEFTPASRRAFRRIFRIFDQDGDNVLCDSELCDTQYRCFDGSINTEELMAIKRQISRVVPGGLHNSCVTFEGFLGLIRMNLDNHQPQTPWTLLRRFDYDDNLELKIPEEIKVTPVLRGDQVTELSQGARSFVQGLALAAYAESLSQQPHSIRRRVNSGTGSKNNNNGVGTAGTGASIGTAESDSSSEEEEHLTWEALKDILSVLTPSAESPWFDPPSFKAQWQFDRSVEQRILLSGLSHMGANLSFEAWLAHWQLLALNDPAVTQVLLFQLGYVEREDLGVIGSSAPIRKLVAHMSMQRRYGMLYPLMPGSTPELPPNPRARGVFKVCVVGDNGVGKSSLVWNISGLRAPGNSDVEFGLEYEKYTDSIVVGGCLYKSPVEGNMDSYSGELTAKKGSSMNVTPYYNTNVNGNNVSNANSSSSSSNKYNNNTKSSVHGQVIDAPCYISVASIPLECLERWLQHDVHSCDLVVVLFQCANLTSLDTAINIEQQLPGSVPRIFFASKADLIPLDSADPIADYSNNGGNNKASASLSGRELLTAHESVLQTISLHTCQHNLPPLILLSNMSGEGLSNATAAIAYTLSNPETAVPSKGKSTVSRKALSLLTSKPFIMFTAAMGVVSLSFVVVKYRDEVKEWLKQFMLNTGHFFVQSVTPLITNRY